VATAPDSDSTAEHPLELEDNCLYTTAVRFEWDPRKAAANARTHGVSFAEAVTVLEEDLPSPVQILTPSRKNAS